MKPEQLAQKDTEDGHQAALFCQATLHLKDFPELKWMFAVPNGGNRDMRQGARLKMTGTRAGVWDIFLPVPITIQAMLGGNGNPSRQYNGLWIEMKKPKTQNQTAGRLQGNQKEFEKHITFFGYASVVCYTWGEAWDAICSYLVHVPEEQRNAYREAMKC